MTSEELIKKFLEIEEKYNFFDMKIGKVKFWQYIRIEVYTAIMESFELYSKSSSLDARFENKADAKELIKRLTVKNQFVLKNRDIVIFSYPRKSKEKDYYKCIYTDLIAKNLDNTYYVFDDKYEGIFYFPRSVSGVKNFDIDFYKTLCKERDRVPFEGRMLEKNIYSVLEKEFETQLTVKQKIRVNTVLIKYLNERGYLKSYYKYVLRRVKPKAVILVCYYNLKMVVLCETAKELGIPTIELQHGTMGNEHIAYNFYKKRNLKVFPDYIFTFSRYDRDFVKFPISRDRIYAVGYPEMENKVRKYEKLRSKHKGKKKVLFISQGLKEIYEYAIKLSKCIDLNKFEIIIKLHPREFGNWRKEFGKKLAGTEIVVIDNNDKDVYYYLSQADYVVGSFSTVLLEATMFNTNIIVIKESSYTYMKELYENGMAVLADSVDTLKDIISNGISTGDNSKSYFERDSIKKIKSAINEIIRKGGNGL